MHVEEYSGVSFKEGFDRVDKSLSKVSLFNKFDEEIMVDSVEGFREIGEDHMCFFCLCLTHPE